MKKFGIKKLAVVLSIIVVLSLVSTAVHADENLGDGFYLRNVDSNSDVVVPEISSAEMRRVLTSSMQYGAGPRFEELGRISRAFYTKFNDEFDFIFYVAYSNLSSGGRNGEWVTLNNDVAGIGWPVNSGTGNFTSVGWGSPSKKLKGSAFVDNGENAIFNGVLLHEFAHKWGVHILDQSDRNAGRPFVGSHWGLSNAGGVLGGFKDVRKLESNRYHASILPNKTGFGLTANFEVPFSDIELYFMGLKSAQELRQANFRLDIYTGGSINSSGDDCPDGYFTATGMKSYTIDDIIGEYGPRVPDASASQKSFKAAVIALTDGTITPNYSRLVTALRWFTGGMNDKSNTSYPNSFNFAQATFGKGSIEINGLRDGGGNDDGGSNDGGAKPGNGSNNSGGGGGGCNAGIGLGALVLISALWTVRRR